MAITLPKAGPMMCGQGLPSTAEISLDALAVNNLRKGSLPGYVRFPNNAKQPPLPPYYQFPNKAAQGRLTLNCRAFLTAPTLAVDHGFAWGEGK